MRERFEVRSDMKIKKLWAAGHALRASDVPDMSDSHLEVLTELSYLSILPAYRHITIQAYTTVLQKFPTTYKSFFARMVNLARRLDTHGSEELATDDDWEAWIESM